MTDENTSQAERLRALLARLESPRGALWAQVTTLAARHGHKALRECIGIAERMATMWSKRVDHLAVHLAQPQARALAYNEHRGHAVAGEHLVGAPVPWRPGKPTRRSACGWTITRLATPDMLRIHSGMCDKCALVGQYTEPTYDLWAKGHEPSTKTFRLWCNVHDVPDDGWPDYHGWIIEFAEWMRDQWMAYDATLSSAEQVTQPADGFVRRWWPTDADYHHTHCYEFHDWLDDTYGDST